jgi:hypothetical protein
LRERSSDWSQKRGSVNDSMYLTSRELMVTVGDFVTNHSERRVSLCVDRSFQK